MTCACPPSTTPADVAPATAHTSACRVASRIRAIREALSALTKAEWDALSEQKAIRDGDAAAEVVWHERADLRVTEAKAALARKEGT